MFLDKGTKKELKKRFKIYNSSIASGKAHTGIDKGQFHDDGKKAKCKSKKKHITSEK